MSNLTPGVTESMITKRAGFTLHPTLGWVDVELAPEVETCPNCGEPEAGGTLCPECAEALRT